MRIKPAAIAHFDPLRELLERHDLPHSDVTPAKLSDFLLAWDGSHLAGAGGLEIHAQDALLRSLVVDTPYRGQGLGTHLVHRLEEHASLNGVRVIYLLTTTAERFFTSLGYARTPRDSAPAALQETDEFRSLCPDSAVCMSRTLA